MKIITFDRNCICITDVIKDTYVSINLNHVVTFSEDLTTGTFSFLYRGGETTRIIYDEIDQTNYPTVESFINDLTEKFLNA